MNLQITPSMIILMCFLAYMLLILGPVCIFFIAKRTGNEANAWWAFIPVLNTVLILRIAEKPLFFLAPLLLGFIGLVLGALWVHPMFAPILMGVSYLLACAVSVYIFIAITEKLNLKIIWAFIMAIIPPAGLPVAAFGTNPVEAT